MGPLSKGEASKTTQDYSADLLYRDPDASNELIEDRRDRGQPLVDSPWQSPGEFVVDANGVLQLTYRISTVRSFRIRASSSR